MLPLPAATLAVLALSLKAERGQRCISKRRHLSGFNIRGGYSLTPEFAALLTGLVVKFSASIAEIVRAGILSVKQGQWEAGRALGLHQRPDHAADRAAAGAARHYAADDLQLSRPDQGLQPGGRHRLSGPRQHHQHDRQHDRPGLRGADHPGRASIWSSTSRVSLLMNVYNQRVALRGGQTGMSDTTQALDAGPASIGSASVAGLWNRIATGLFGSRINTAITLVTVGAACLDRAADPALDFASTRHGPVPPQDCAARAGACWAFIGKKLRFILFGFYPPRAAMAAGARDGPAAVAADGQALPRFWRRELLWSPGRRRSGSASC